MSNRKSEADEQEERKSLITEPVHDPNALGTALPLGGSIAPRVEKPNDGGEPIPGVSGFDVPDPEKMTGAEQVRVEVATGKRLQPEVPENDEAATKKAEAQRAKDAEKNAAEGPTPVAPIVEPVDEKKNSKK